MEPTASLVPVLLPGAMLAASVVTAAVGVFSPRAARWVSVVATAVATVVAAMALSRVVGGELLQSTFGGWSAELGISYRMDLLSGFLTVLVCFIAFLAVLYPPKVGYQVEPDRHLPVHALTMLLLTGVLGVVLTADLFNLFVFIEIYSISAYALIALGGPLAALAAFRYLLIGTVASSVYLLGVGFVYFSTGTLNMAEAAGRLEALGESPTLVTAAVLLIVGLAVKMALFPFHVWVPDAHSNATPAVHVFLAAVMVKVGAYAVLRIVFDVLPDSLYEFFPLFDLLIATGMVAVVFGSWMSFRQVDYKRMLAYSTVAQMGYIAIGIGLNTPVALVGALLLVLVHSFMKAIMFFVAGSVYDSTGRKKIPQFAGLGRRMPWTMAGFTLAAASMVGLPPTGGFFAKFYLVTGAGGLRAWVIGAFIVASSLLTLAYFLPIVESIWFKPDADPARPPNRDDDRAGTVAADMAGAGSATGDAAVAVATDQPVVRTESSFLVVLPIIGLGVGVVVIGLINLTIVEELLRPMADQLLGSGP